MMKKPKTHIIIRLEFTPEDIERIKKASKINGHKGKMKPWIEWLVMDELKNRKYWSESQ